MNSLFHISNLQFGYSSSLVLRSLSTEIAADEFVGLIGPNGAGKSTLLKIMASLLRGYHSSVDFSGKSLSQWNSRDLAKRVAFVPQETHIVFPFTAGEIVMMERLPHRARLVFDRPRDVDLTGEAMALTDTASLASKIFNQLNGGERQRVVLASAL